MQFNQNWLNLSIASQVCSRYCPIALLTKRGFDALANERAGKQTLRTHKVEVQPLAEVTAEEPVTLRERLHLSRPVFAGYLRTNPRTLENWGLGQAEHPGLATDSPGREVSGRGRSACRGLIAFQ